MKHEHDQRIKESTCPGCGSHLARANGLKVAHFRVAPESANTLNGLAPESVLQLAGRAIQFWCVRVLHDANAIICPIKSPHDCRQD